MASHVTRALVLDAGSPAGVETVQALGRAGVEVDAADTVATSLAFRSRYPRQRLQQPSPARPLEFLGWLEDLDTASGYTLIVPSTEGSLLALRRRPAGDLLRAKAVLPTDDALDAALDKERTLDLAARLGIPVPHSRVIGSLEAAGPVTEFPLVLKPARSTALIGADVVILSAAIVRDEGERRAALSDLLRHGPVQEQRWVGGHGVGVEMLFDRGEEVWHFAHERVHEVPLTGGGSTYRRSIRPPSALLAAARALLGALGWHGVAMVEFRVGGDGSFHLMEINPRLWGSLALAIDCGVNFPLGLWRIAAGLPAERQPVYRTRYFTRHLPRDLEWLRANWRADHRDSLLLTRPRGRAVIELGRPLSGRESWDHFDARDLGVTGALLARLVAACLRRVRMRFGQRRLTHRIVTHHARHFGARVASGPPVRRLLFVCHGNICRSPFAARLARERLDGCFVESAGVHAMPDIPSPERIVRVAGTMGIDLGGGGSQRVGVALVASADLILTMDLDNWKEMAARFPGAAPKMTMLGLFAERPRAVIPDPNLMSEAQTREVFEQIREAVDGLASWLRGDVGTGAGTRFGSAVAGAVGVAVDSGDASCVE